MTTTIIMLTKPTKKSPNSARNCSTQVKATTIAIAIAMTIMRGDHGQTPSK